MLHSAQGESLALITHSNPIPDHHTFNNPQATIIIHNTGNITDHIKDIKKFLKQQSGQEFESEKALFGRHDILRWHGFTNKMLISHVRVKLNQLKTSPAQTRIDSSSTDISSVRESSADVYAQMLEDLIEYSETNDKEQKKNICKKAVITGVGTVLLTAIQYFTNYIPYIN